MVSQISFSAILNIHRTLCCFLSSYADNSLLKEPATIAMVINSRKEAAISEAITTW
jgi:hypothetical protein